MERAGGQRGRGPAPPELECDRDVDFYVLYMKTAKEASIPHQRFYGIFRDLVGYPQNTQLKGMAAQETDTVV